MSLSYLWKHENHTGTHVPFDVDVHRHTASSHKEYDEKFRLHLRAKSVYIFIYK